MPNDKRTPTPVIRGNLPRLTENMADESEGGEGREIESPIMKWYERADARGNSQGSLRWGDYGPYPKEPPGTRRGRGLTEDDIYKLRVNEPTAGYAKGGIIRGPFAEGGPVLPRSGKNHAKNAAKR